jgi:hypothetical protein
MRGLTEVLSWYLRGGIAERHDKRYVKIVRVLARIDPKTSRIRVKTITATLTLSSNEDM